MKDGTVLPVKPGQPIPFPVEAKGRFEPVTVNKWLGAHSINVPDAYEREDAGPSKVRKRNERAGKGSCAGMVTRRKNPISSSIRQNTSSWS